MKIQISGLLTSWFVICMIVLGGDSIMAQSSAKGSASKSKMPKFQPVEFENGTAKLSPMNTKIEFIGTHVAADPKPRLGGFKEFTGAVKLAADNSIESISFEINVNSVWTQFDDLTKHLKNADFFETDKYPTAKFVSTEVVAGNDGMKVTGNLTLHGTTKQIMFPVNGQLSPKGVIMLSEFKLDRSMFGMDKMTSGVDKMVSLKLVVGQKTEVSGSAAGPGTEKKGSESKGSDKRQPELTSVKLYAPNMT